MTATPSTEELIQLVRIQEDVITELTAQLDAVQGNSSDDLSSSAAGERATRIDDSPSEAQKLAREFRAKLDESLGVIGDLVNKNKALSSKLAHKEHERLGFTPASISLFEMHSLLEAEKSKNRKLALKFAESRKQEEALGREIERLKEDADVRKKQFLTEKEHAKKKSEKTIMDLVTKASENAAALSEAQTLKNRLKFTEKALVTQKNNYDHIVGQLQAELVASKKRISQMEQRILDLSIQVLGDQRQTGTHEFSTTAANASGNEKYRKHDQKDVYRCVQKQNKELPRKDGAVNQNPAAVLRSLQADIQDPSIAANHHKYLLTL